MPHRWKPIEDLPHDWKQLVPPDLESLALVWKDQSAKLRTSESLRRFNDRLRREWAIETGIIENLYTVYRGTTALLIEKGIAESLIPHDKGREPIGEEN